MGYGCVYDDDCMLGIWVALGYEIALLVALHGIWVCITGGTAWNGEGREWWVMDVCIMMILCMGCCLHRGLVCIAGEIPWTMRLHYGWILHGTVVLHCWGELAWNTGLHYKWFFAQEWSWLHWTLGE